MSDDYKNVVPLKIRRTSRAAPKTKPTANAIATEYTKWKYHIWASVPPNIQHVSTSSRKGRSEDQGGRSSLTEQRRGGGVRTSDDQVRAALGRRQPCDALTGAVSAIKVAVVSSECLSCAVSESLADAANIVPQLPLMRYRLRFRVGDAQALRGV